MRFIEIINKKKFVLISIFLFLYVLLNLLDGERGLISYLAKQELKDQLVTEKKLLVTKLNSIPISKKMIRKTPDIYPMGELTQKSVDIFLATDK